MSSAQNTESAVSSLVQRWDEREKLDNERRKVDDARYETLAKRHEILIERVDKHGERTTALETKWAAFFDEKTGAFRYVTQGMEKLNTKTDKMAWLLAIGIGIMWAIQYFHPGVR